MRIGIDIRPLATHHRYRGVGVYLKNLLEALSEIDHSNTYVLFTVSGERPELSLAKGFQYELQNAGLLPGNTKSRLKAAYKPLNWTTNKWGLDIFFQPDVSNGFPSGSAKKVGLFYDLIPVIFESQYRPRPRPLTRDWLIQKLLWQAYIHGLHSYKKLSATIAISNSSRLDLLKFESRLDPDRVYVVPLGVRMPKVRYHQAKSPSLPFFLYVGSCDYRKNVPAIVEAFNQIRKGYACQLVLVGKDIAETPDPQLVAAIKNSPYSEDILTPGFVDDKELGRLYHQAAAFVFASLYEGFGLPILEAMAYGCPVISYENSSLDEVSNGAALMVDGADAMAEKMVTILKMSKAERQKIIQRGLSRAAECSWQITARQTLEVFTEL